MQYYDLSLPQKSVYDMELFGEGAIATITADVFFSGEFDREILAYSINKVIEYNDALRIQLDFTASKARQYFTEYSEQDIPCKVFVSKKQYMNWAESYAKIPLDTKKSLFEITIISFKGKFGVILKCHHLIGDAWSILAYLHQIFRFNKLLSEKHQLEDEKQYSYLSYISREQNYLKSERYLRDKNYWLDVLSLHKTPTVFSQKASNNQQSQRKLFVLDQKLDDQISEYCKKNNTSEFALFLTVLAIYIYKKTNQNDLYIGTTILNRKTAEDKKTSGMFVNTVPMQIDIMPDNSVLDNIESAKKSIRNIFRHQEYSYTEVLQDARTHFGLTDRLTDIYFNYQNVDKSFGEGHAFNTWYHCGYQTESLNIHVGRNAKKKLEIFYDYQIAKFKEWEIEYLHKQYYHLLQSVVQADKTPVKQLSCLDSDEFNQVIYKFNDTAAKYPSDKTVVDLFEEQVKKTPGNVAVVYEDKKITYGELNAKANQLAYRLRESGVKPDDKVAILTQRSIEMIIGIYGIIKAGGAYVPMDPGYPSDRIKYMMDDCQPRAIVLGKAELPEKNGDTGHRPFRQKYIYRGVPKS
ncbi:MAG TPA: condensation domain-containing protein [Ruminiclostridium sp.]|nr:condensation domain-containing protein [Ruminiclostridium sp.]